MKEATIATAIFVAFVAGAWYGLQGLFWCVQRFGPKPVIWGVGIVLIILVWVWALVLSGDTYDIRRFDD